MPIYNRTEDGILSGSFYSEQRIANLIAILQSYSLHHGAERKLVSRLDAARAALASHDSSGACADLDAFRLQVAKLSGHALTLAQALALDRGAGEIQQRLGCSQPGFAATAAARVPTEFAFRLQSSPAVTAEAQVDLPAPGPVRVDVFDINGRLVRTAFDAPLAPGTHSIAWDGRAAEGGRAPVGVYFLRVVSGREVAVARFVLLR